MLNIPTMMDGPGKAKSSQLTIISVLMSTCDNINMFKIHKKENLEPMCVCVLSHSVMALQAPLSMGFSRQEDWSGLPFPPPGDLASLLSPALAGGFFTTSATWEASTSTA